MRFVIALGGNALEGNYASLKKISSVIYSLWKKGNSILITHGNGPQVGELAEVESKSLAILTAQTQAEIGVKIKNTLEENFVLKARGNNPPKVAIVISEVLVDRNDTAFRNPTKPVGRFYRKEEAIKHARKGISFRKFENGYRRIVASPIPKDIIDADIIKSLAEQRYIVIAVGGGGIAVSRRGKLLPFEEAVIDKDYASFLLAKATRADSLVILTTTNGAYTNFKKKGQRMIREISVKEAKVLMKSGEFGIGTMQPKVDACIRFVEWSGKKAIIGNLDDPISAINGKGCTVISA